MRPLFTQLDYNLIISAVIERTSPGKIYVDDVVNPETAFLCSVEGYYLAGYVNNDAFNKALNRLIFDRLFAGDTVRKDETDISIGFHPPSWQDKMKVVFKGRTPLKAARRHYVCSELEIPNWKKRVPDGFSVQRVDEKFLRKWGLKIPVHMTDWMETNWGSIEDFLQRGFGFYTSHGEKGVSWSIADCVSGDACEIGIHTHLDYRRRGLATVTAAAAVDYCLSHGFTSVGWHCDEYNQPSMKTAEKVGFKLERKYVQYYACSNEAHHLEETAQAHFRAKRFRETIECYERFFATPQEELPEWFRKVLPRELGTHCFRAAYAKARIGEKNGALKYLEKAIDNGWLYIDFLKNCKEFKSIHGTAAWDRILKKIHEKLNEH